MWAHLIQKVWHLVLIMSHGISMEIPPTLSFLHLFEENKDGNFTSAEKKVRGISIIVNRVIWDEWGKLDKYPWHQDPREAFQGL